MGTVGILGGGQLARMLALAAAPLGARLAHRLPQVWLKRAFAVLLLGIGIAMLIR